MTKQVMAAVNGPIKPEELAFTSMHEHVLMTAPFVYELWY